MKTKSNRSRAPACLSILAVFLCAGVFLFSLLGPVSAPGAVPVHFTVSRGESGAEIVSGLFRAGLIRSDTAARLYARLFRLSLKAGTFRLSSSMGTPAILKLLDEGKQEYTRVTIPEGLTLRKTAEHLQRAGIVQAKDFIAAASEPGVLEARGIPGATAEGFLFPDTYFFPWGADARSVVSIMVDTFFRRTAAVPGLPADPAELYRKVILASVIEREYRVRSEAPEIASVFSNRLAIGMGLQSCATVEYIITEIQGKPHPGRLSLEDLEIESPYNTYTWAGLPPGPISNPGLVALGAAFRPADTKYLYFRLTDPETGTHSFSRSLEEHVRAGRALELKKAAGD